MYVAVYVSTCPFPILHVGGQASVCVFISVVYVGRILFVELLGFYRCGLGCWFSPALCGTFQGLPVLFFLWTCAMGVPRSFWLWVVLFPGSRGFLPGVPGNFLCTGSLRVAQDYISNCRYYCCVGIKERVSCGFSTVEFA